MQDQNLENIRKRDASPLKQPAAKKQQTSDILSATINSTVAIPQEELNNWENISQEMSWTPVDCLSHKLSLPKNTAPVKKVDTLGVHVKRLRAAGWYLLQSKENALADTMNTKERLENERTVRAEQEKKLQEALETAQVENQGHCQKIVSLEAEVDRRNTEINSLERQIQDTKSKLESSEASLASVSAQLATQEATTAAIQQRLDASETAVAEGQKYSSQLQQYNTKLQEDLAAAQETASRLQEDKATLHEEAASLRGRVAALNDALTALQSVSVSNEEARQHAMDEATRLRAELASSHADRASLTDSLTRLRKETEEQKNDLERFRVATGKDLEALEAERASSAVLASRTEAQAAMVSALQDQLALVKDQKMAAEAHAELSSNEIRSLTARNSELQSLLDDSEKRLRESEATRRKLHNMILELKGNVRVFCRVRPVLNAGNTDTTYTTPGGGEDNVDNSVAVKVPMEGDLAGRGLILTHHTHQQHISSKGPQNLSFTFDRVFGPRARQDEVFEEVSALVQSSLDGYKVCIFAYGQTGSGKTHTMLGRDGDEGIIPRAVRQIFNTAEASAANGWHYEIKAAMVEVYNEELRDLIGKGPPPGKKHVINAAQDDRNNAPSSSQTTGLTGCGPNVSYLEWVDVNRAESVAPLLKRAMSQRAVGATAANEQSSRSHMVFMLAIQGFHEASGQRLTGALNLVDLAGSERLDKSEAQGERLKETQAINKSLSALGDVIAALGCKDSHVPYRNSKLTFLLQNSLSGAGKALMLCNVAPSVDSAQESLCTLRFAAKVNATEIGVARRNVSL